MGLSLALVAAGPLAAQTPAGPLLDPAAIRRHVEVLSSDAFFGPGPGEAGEMATLDYLVARFREAGLQPGGDYHQRSDEFDPSWDLVAAAQEGMVAYLLGREIADSGRWPTWNDGVPYTALRDASATSRP